MKKFFILLIFTILLVPFGTQAQLNETFSGLTLATSGTVVIGGLPTNWVQINVDGLTPYSGFSYMGTNAWISRKMTFSYGVDTVTQSISYYTPFAASNDWLITPAFTVASASTYLIWEGYAPDPSYADGYKVKIATNAGTTTADFPTQLLSVPAENSTGFLTHAISLGAYAGQTIRVAFINDSNDKFYLLLDDFRTVDLNYYDAELAGLNVARYGATNSNVQIKGTVKNNGLPITSLVIEWNDGGSPNSATLSGLNIAPFGSYEFTHTIPFNKSVADEFNISVNITSVNGGATETSTTNNSASTKISTVSNPAPRSVVVEEGTGTWCGWCPRGAVAMEATYNNHPDGSFIGIAVHNGDPMVLTAYDDGAGISGFPGCNVDRILMDQGVSSDFESLYDLRINVMSPVLPGVSVSYNEISRVFTINATAEFRTKISTGAKFLCVVKQDDVHGTTTGWEQQNYYSGGTTAMSGAGHNWQTEPDVVPAASMYYDHVGVALLADGNYDGDAGSVPALINDGTTATKVFTYTMPAGLNPDNFEFVVMVLDNITGEILNAREGKFAAPPALSWTPADGAINFPITDNIVLNFNVPMRMLDNSAITSANVASLITLKTNNASGDNVAFTATISADNKVITVDPVLHLTGLSTYYCAIGATIENSSDVAITAGSTTFTTANGVGFDNISQNANAISVSPNPANNNANLSFNLSKSSNVEYSVVNVLGEELSVNRIGQMPAGQHVIPVELANLNNGMYFLRLSVDGKAGLIKVMVQH